MGGEPRPPQKTLLIYSGPTSTDRTRDKNGMYIDNMNYFLEHGVSCPNEQTQQHLPNQAEPVDVSYVFVVTQDVADYYTAPEGLVTKKRRECQPSPSTSTSSAEEHIKVIVRKDRCYDMESMRVVLDQMDVEKNYDDLLFINCGLVGPKFGPGSPTHIPSSTNVHVSQKASPKMVPYSHWSQIYTSRLSDSLRIVGHSINTHFHTYFPHVQSFLYAIRTETIPILLSSGAIYDCGLTQEELASDSAKRFELIQRYEVGMSTQLLNRGFQIGTAFINRWGMGTPLVLDRNSTQGTELDDTICDIWYEDGVRNLTKTVDKSLKWWVDTNSTLRSKDSFDYHQWDILPWDHFVFFKVSRLVPEDIQAIMNYNHLELVDVDVVPNDPRKSRSEFWQRKTREFDQRRSGIPMWNVMIMVILFTIGYSKRKQIEMRLRVLRKQIVSRDVRED